MVIACTSILLDQLLLNKCHGNGILKLFNLLSENYSFCIEFTKQVS